MLLVYLAVAWAAGIAVASVVRLPWIVWCWWLILPVGLFLIWRRDALLRQIHLLLLVFLLAALRYTLALPHFDETSLATYNDRGTMLLIGDVEHPPEVRDNSMRIRLAVTRIRLENKWRDVTGIALVNAPRETDVRYGDQAQIFGEPTTPPDEEDFSYKDYLARQSVYSLVRTYGEVKIFARDRGNPCFNTLYAFRDRAHAAIYAILPDPAASLLAGILLGMDEGIPRDVTDAFSKTNTAHIVAISAVAQNSLWDAHNRCFSAPLRPNSPRGDFLKVSFAVSPISGFNIAIIAGIFAALARRIVGAKRATLVVILGLVAYTLLVGASASVVRAAIMGSLSLIAAHYGRQNTALNSLSAAALVMLALNPFTLYDMGFQLSFLATLGLILYVTPLTAAFEKLFARFIPGKRAKQIVGVLNDSFIVTLAAQITTTPLILFAFHRFSIVGLLTNLIVLPIQPAVMIAGGVAILTAMAFQPAGQIIGWVAWVFLEFTIVVVQFTASLPFASIDVGRFDLWIIVAYYVILFGLTFVGWEQVRAHIVFRPAVALCVALVLGMWGWNIALTAPDGKTHVEFFDGGTTFVRTPRGVRVLIDGGADASVVLSALGERIAFWDRTLDVLVLTSADDEHLGSLIEAIGRYDVRQIVAVNSPAKPTTAFLKWSQVTANKRVPILPAQAGTMLALDRNSMIEIAHPTDVTNARAAVVRLRAGNHTFLFADAVTPDDQTEMVKSSEVASTVLIAPRKTTAEFAELVNPHYAILFGGHSARDKISPDTLAALLRTEILQTAERGTIEMIVDGETLIVKTAR